MAHIKVEEGVPGIRSLAMFRPDTGKHLYHLVQILLRGPSTLSEAQREMIAAAVSKENECSFCMNSHAAAARCLLGDDKQQVDDVLKQGGNVVNDKKFSALLNIARKVAHSGKEVKPEDILQARESGADDREIHDTVLIAATFSMCNRYVDGLDTLTPTNEADYVEMGKRMAKGYVLPT
jgi:uncharacterized peroxidase-related enzyme